MYCAPMKTEASRKQYLVKLDKQEKAFYNFYGYPYITEEGDNELEWWVRKDIYAQLRGGV